VATKRYYDSNYVLWEDTVPVDSFQSAIGKGVYLSNGAVHHETTMDNRIIKFDVLTEPEADPNSPFYSQRQVLRIFGNDAALTGQDDWKRFLDLIIPSHGMVNYTFDFEKAEYPPTGSYSMSKVHNNISFYEYERRSKALNTKILPNYSLTQHYKYNTYNPIEKNRLINYLNFNDTIPSAENMVNRSWYINYYDKYVEKTREILENSAEVLNKNNNLFLLGEYGSIQQDIENVPYALEMNLHVEDLVNTDFFFTKALEDTHKVKNVFQFVKNKQPTTLSFTNSEGTEEGYKTYDFMSWFTDHGAEMFQESTNELFLLPQDEQGIEGDIASSFYSVMLLSRMRDVAKNKLRDAEKLLNFDPCSTEVIGFKIEKYLNDARVSPDQVIYVKGSTFNLVDTQMKFDEKYSYDVYAIMCVVGTEYNYTDLKHSSADGFISRVTNLPTTAAGGQETEEAFYSAEVTLVSRPSIRIVEVPFSNSEHYAIGIPPNRPEYQFSVESNKSNELNILLMNSLNEEEEHAYVTLSSEDEYNLAKIRTAQGPIANLTPPNQVWTSYKYNCGKFEVYRLDETPTKLTDFADKKLTTIGKKVDYLHISTGDYDPDYNSGYSRSQTTWCANYKDFVLPNKKYYYLFKAISEHGLPSPPTEILEVEVIKDSNEAKVVVNPYIIEKTNNDSYHINMRRFLQIVPNIQQVELNKSLMGEADSANLLQPHLGILDKSLWDKKFKIRLTSKHTGKKIDINVVFKINEA